ncbi:MAG TPA: hypothetical protein VIJ29_01365 [Candidatus Paceibacterota bacterium]
MGATEIKKGDPVNGATYEAMVAVADLFGYNDAIPSLYLIPTANDEVEGYLTESVVTDGRGKIFISQAMIAGFGNDIPALEGWFGDEMSYLAKDKEGEGKRPCETYALTKRDAYEEEDADADAAGHLHRGPVIAFLSRLLELVVAGKVDSPDTPMGITGRLQAVQSLSDKTQ